MSDITTPLPNLCRWTGSRPGPGESIDCTACGRTCDARMVRLCRARGPNPSSTPQPAKRMDWLSEIGGCVHSGPVVESLSCGCAGQSGVTIRSCSQPTLNGECVVLDGDLKRLGRKHRDRAKSVTACESCTLRTSAEQPTLGPFTGEPIRHCIGHLWPFAGNDLWRWHVAQLVDRLPLFNGRRLISVALDDRTVNREEVEAALAGHAVELQFIANRKATGETDSFRWGLEQLQGEIDNPNACLFYWHSKGVSTREDDSKHNWHSVRRWADSMWRTNGDCWPLIQQQLETAHATGSHRQPWPGKKDIYFSGTFFWVRLAALLGRPWHQLDADRFAVERWPGQMFRPHETACLFDDRLTDRTAPGTLYRESTWSALTPQLEEFLRQYGIPATTYANALAKYVVDGRQDRSPEEQAAILATCSRCPLLGKDGSCDGCGCVVAEKVKMRLEACPAGKWFEDVRPANPITDPVRNLIYHLLPTTLHDGWKRNLDQLARRWSVFTGRKYLSVVTTDGGINNTRNGDALQTVPSLDVMAYCERLGITWTEVRQVANNGKLGEVVSLPWLLDAVMNDDPNEVTFYAHSKGTTRPQGATLDHWRGSMYHYCLDDIATVDRALERFSCAASLLRNDPMSANKWHPSGTFFWFRNADLFAKDWTKIQQSYHGVEAYIGDHFKRHEVAALAHPNMGNLYVQTEWDRHKRASEVWDAARAMDAEPVVIAPTPEPIQPPPKVIALYLPAFHRDPLNDRAWGNGWTEWDNLRRWKPNNPGHTIQRPHADIGEYDLLSVETRRKQAELANAHGVRGFAVYHYWFNGVKALHQPYEQMLLDGEPDLPFHFIWANEPWTKRWDGRDSEVIQSQTYSGRDEWRAHAEYLRPFIEHRNYIQHEGRRVFGIYRPGTIPHLTERLNYYREVLGSDLHFTTLFGTFGADQVPSNYPILDSAIEFAPHANASGWEHFALHPHQRLFRGACPSWDNSPRRGADASIHSLPLFADQLNSLRGEDVIYINAWNEWGEQAALEPSDRDGFDRLNEIAAFTGTRP